MYSFIPLLMQSRLSLPSSLSSLLNSPSLSIQQLDELDSTSQSLLFAFLPSLILHSFVALLNASTLSIGSFAALSASDFTQKPAAPRVYLSENTSQLQFVLSGEFWRRQADAFRTRKEAEKLYFKERKLWTEFLKRFGMILRCVFSCASLKEGTNTPKESQKRESSARRTSRQREKDTSEFSRRRSLSFRPTELLLTKPLSSFDNDLYIYSRPYSIWFCFIAAFRGPKSSTTSLRLNELRNSRSTR